MYNSTEHEEQINSLVNLLNVEGVDVAQVSLIIQNLRNNYDEVNTNISESVAFKEKVDKNIEELKRANNKLLLQLGTQYSSMLEVDKQKLKDEALNKGGKEEKTIKDEIISTDDIINNFI